MFLFEVFHQPAHHRSHATRILDQIVFFIYRNRCKSGGTCEWMTIVSKTTEEDVVLEVIGNLTSHAHCAECYIRARQSLRHRDQIRHDFPVVDREPLASASETGHHFVGDQENAVLVAKITQAL